jgi:hypothetical protein
MLPTKRKRRRRRGRRWRSELITIHDLANLISFVGKLWVYSCPVVYWGFDTGIPFLMLSLACTSLTLFNLLGVAFHQRGWLALPSTHLSCAKSNSISCNFPPAYNYFHDRDSSPIISPLLHHYNTNHHASPAQQEVC